MIRGIDNQLMMQQSMNAARIAGDRMADKETRKAFQAQFEQERIANEQHSVKELEAAEHRRVERDKDERQEPEDFIDEEIRLLNKNKKKKILDADGKTEKLLGGVVGFEIDIDA